MTPEYLPDSNNLAHIERIVIQLSDEDGCHCLIERCAIHVDSGAHWENKAGDPFINVVVLLSASKGDRQRGRAESQYSECHHCGLM